MDRLVMTPATVFWRHREIQYGRDEVSDEERCGRKSDVRTPDLLDKICIFLNEDHWISFLTVAAQFGVVL